MKKIFLVFVLLCVTGCQSAKKNTSSGNPSACGDTSTKGCAVDVEEEADMHAYGQDASEDHQFVQSDMQSILDMIQQKKSGIVYFGFPMCPWCQEALPIINEVAKDMKQHIYYVQTRDDQKKQLYTDKQKTQMMKLANAYLDTDEDGHKQFFVPFVVVFKAGHVVAGHVGTVPGYDTSKRKMNADEKQQLKSIYKAMFTKVAKK